ncbi:Cadherin-like protein [Pseudocohnilembus persalinus]|uniref:Cadherin-like protein n=1 Tax=Pseudocohnilembus persalinus TaxID=266149 RepID=A0A0V0QX34_PSEPJ|nr:Cadherin-like protein [Pseudocohnilembus persalinus]|eukprot:KRX06576.1 Cadherin-like protein [Pseudocohnilembus persalinus]
MDYYDLSLKRNYPLPKWMQVQILHGVIRIQGVPQIEDIATDKFKFIIQDKLGYVLKEFWVNVKGNQRLPKVTEDEIFQYIVERKIKQKQKEMEKQKKIFEKTREREMNINGLRLVKGAKMLKNSQNQEDQQNLLQGFQSVLLQNDEKQKLQNQTEKPQNLNNMLQEFQKSLPDLQHESNTPNLYQNQMLKFDSELELAINFKEQNQLQSEQDLNIKNQEKYDGLIILYDGQKKYYIEKSEIQSKSSEKQSERDEKIIKQEQNQQINDKFIDLEEDETESIQQQQKSNYNISEQQLKQHVVIIPNYENDEDDIQSYKQNPQQQIRGYNKPVDVSSDYIYLQYYESSSNSYIYENYSFSWPNYLPTWVKNSTTLYPQEYLNLFYPTHILVTSDFYAEILNCFIDNDDDPMQYEFFYKEKEQNSSFWREWDLPYAGFYYNETSLNFEFSGNAPLAELGAIYDVRIKALDVSGKGTYSQSFYFNLTNTQPTVVIDGEDGESSIQSIQQLFEAQYPHPRPFSYIEFLVGEYLIDQDLDDLVYVAEFYNSTSLAWESAVPENDKLWIYFNSTSFTFDGYPQIDLLNTIFKLRLKACDLLVCSDLHNIDITFINNIPVWGESIDLQLLFNSQNQNPKANEQVKFDFLDGIGSDADGDKVYFYIYYADESQYLQGIWNEMHNDYSLHQCIAEFGYTHVENAGLEYIQDDGEVKYVEGCYLKDEEGNLLDGEHLHKDQWLINNLNDGYITGLAPEGINDSILYLKVILSDKVQNNTETREIIVDFYNYPPEMNPLVEPLQDQFLKLVGKAKILEQMAFEFSENMFTDKDNDIVYIQYWYKEFIDGEDTEWKEFDEDFFLKYIVEFQLIKFQGMASNLYKDKKIIVNITGFDGYKYNEYNEDLTFTIDFKNQPPILDTTKTDLQTQFNQQVSNPQVGKAVSFGLNMPYYDIEDDDIIYIIEYYDQISGDFKQLQDQWISFNVLSFQFFGIPTVEYMDTIYTIRVIANDGQYNTTNFQYIDIDLTNQQPMINSTLDSLQYQFDAQIPKPYTYLNNLMIFQAFFDPFYDDDEVDELEYYIEYVFNDQNGVYQDISQSGWIGGNPNKLFLVINAPLSIVDNIVYLKFYVSDGFKQSDPQYVKIDFSDQKPVQNPNIQANLQEQFDYINPNPQVGQYLQFSLKSLFYDADNDLLTYQMDFSVYDKNDNLIQNWKTLENEWLSFYEQQLLLAGIPDAKYMDQLYKLRISCTDGFKTSEYLYLTIDLYNQKPYINSIQQSIQDQFDYENPVTQVYQTIKFTVPGDRFSDDDEKDNLIYIAEYKSPNGSWKKLENQWITFNQQNLIFKGYATIDLLDTYYYIRVYASDGYKQSEYDYLTINFHAEAPYQDPTQLSLQEQIDYFLSNSLTVLQADKPFSFTLYDDTYNDVDSTRLTYITYVRTRYQFNSFEYNAGHNRQLQIQESDVEDDGTFKYSCRADSEISAQYPWDPVWSDWVQLLSYNQEETWLIFDETDLKFSGTPSANQVGDYQLKIVVTDGVKQMTDSMYFKICNTSPYLNQQLKLQSQIDKMPVQSQTWNFYINPDTFVDNDFDVLTYQATLIDGAPLPGSITFNNDTLRFSGKFSQVTKANMTNFIQKLFYDEPIEVKIIAKDPVGGEAYDVFYIEVLMSFESGLLIAIQVLSLHITSGAQIKQLKNQSLAKDQQLSQQKWMEALFFDENLVLRKEELKQELEEVRSLLNYNKTFMTLTNANGQSTNIYKVLKYMAYVEFVEQSSQFSWIMERMKVKICEEFYQEKQKSKYSYYDYQVNQMKEIVKINVDNKNNRSKMKRTFLDWYYPITQIIYYQGPNDSNLLMAKKFPKILVNQKYISTAYLEIIKEMKSSNDKKQFQFYQSEKILEGNDKQESKQQQEINLIRKYIVSKAQGIGIYNYTKPPEITQGESILQNSKELDHVQGQQKVEVFSITDKIKNKLGFLNLDYEPIALAENKLLPDWLQIKQSHDCLILYGTPQMNDIGDIKIQIISKQRYIMREFFIRVNGPQYLNQLNFDEYNKFERFNNNQQTEVVKLEDPREFKGIYKNDIEGLALESSSESEVEEKVVKKEKVNELATKMKRARSQKLKTESDAQKNQDNQNAQIQNQLTSFANSSIDNGYLEDNSSETQQNKCQTKSKQFTARYLID